MPGYLLDTNHICAWESGDPKFLARARKEPVENTLWVCPISIGEVEWGLCSTSTTNQARRDACRRFLATEVLQFVWEMRATTGVVYGDVMRRIWEKHKPASGRVETQAHLSSLGVDVNDVWIAAVAIEHGLTLLTSDRLDTLRECVPELKVDNWLL